MLNMRAPLLSLGILGLAASAAAAQTAVEACGENDSDFATRIAACQTLEADDGFTDRAWLYERMGDAYEEAEDFDTAISFYDRSLGINPDHPFALYGRAYSNIRRSEPGQAVVDTTHLTRIEPDDQYNFHLHGWALANLDRHDEALAAFTEALRIDPDYYNAGIRRGRLFAEMDQPARAEADFRRVAEAHPFEYLPYWDLGDLFRDTDKPIEAAGQYLIALSISPNLGRVERELERLVSLPGVAPDLAPLDYAPPSSDTDIVFLQMVLPRQTQSEMELAIGELAAWFAPTPKAEPISGTILARNFTTGDRDRVEIGLDLRASMTDLDRAHIPTDVGTYRGLMPVDIQNGADAPRLVTRHETAALSDVWPLQEGKSVSGTGSIYVQCPGGFHMPSMMMGCRIGMDEAKSGEIEYELTVLAPETIHVPLGIFDTHVLRYREKTSIETIGQMNERIVETTWWIAPDLNFWVKRTSQQGENIAVLQAMALE